MRETAIAVSHLSFSVPGKQILDGVVFDVFDGEILSIIGPNGAGKSTLLKCLNRILPGGLETCKVRGKTLKDYDSKELARTMSYVPQALGNGSPFIVHDFVMMSRYSRSSRFTLGCRADVQAVDRALALTDMQEYRSRSLCSLSGGERQKAYVAAALAQEAGIMLLDEPTVFLDPQNQAEIYGILRRLNREEGITIVLATHDVNNAMITSDRVLGLKEGRVVMICTPQELADGKALQELYGKSFLFVPHPQNGLPIVVPEALHQ